ncbi:MAG: energy transducer TonB [Bacteroidaceae bacterium]|nr:energy transducer TonB [Bacteroidaceae bacterium]
MKYFITYTILSILSILPMKAQFFDFGFPEFRQEQPRQKAEPIQNPKFKGGSKGVNRFIEKEFKTVPSAYEASGQIVVACIINEKGRISEAEILRGMQKELNEEALRVVKKMKFKPAKQGKKKVKYQYNITFPIRWGRVSFLNIPTTEI